MRSRTREQWGPLAMRTRLMQPFTSVLGDPMLRNGYALIASATVTQVLGVGYWIVAARTAPPAVVGRNSAAIHMILFLAGVAELNLMSTPRVARHAGAPRRHPSGGAARDVRRDGHVARVTTPVPTDVWEAVAGADPGVD